MPSLVLSSRFTSDSQILRAAAQSQGWETVRLDGESIPEFFEPPDEQIALFYTAPHAFDVAAQLGRTLLGCNAAWTTELPPRFLNRTLQQMTLAEALRQQGVFFAKHSVSKAFPAMVGDADKLRQVTEKISRDALVHVGEPVRWLVEYRCFVAHGNVLTLSPYVRHGEIIEAHQAAALQAPPEEIEQAHRFAQMVLDSLEVAYPDAFVLDVGIIEGRGWSVVEFNECWASGIYACDPVRVLDSLRHACVPTARLTVSQLRWDFERHYRAACA